MTCFYVAVFLSRIRVYFREMDEILESVDAEHCEVEKAAGEFANTMKTYINFRHEANRVRVKHMQQVISADILYEENEEIKEQVRELYDQINEIKERHAIGLQGLRRETEEMKCTAEMIREKNEEDEKEIKSKEEEFNRMKMILTEEGIEYVTNRRHAQNTERDTSILNACAPLSRPFQTKGVVDYLTKIDTRDVSCVAPYMENKDETFDSVIYENNESHQVTEPVESQRYYAERTYTGEQSLDSPVVIKLPKESERDFRNEDSISPEPLEPGKLKQQMSASELRLSEVRKRTSRIPKPLVQPYGSASRDGDRFVVSKSNSLVVIQSERYKRDAFVPENQRYFTKPTMDFLDADTELRRLKKKSRSDIGGRQDMTRNYSPILEFERRDFVNTLHSKTDRSHKYSEDKPKVTRIKKEVKSKIDTGLKSRPSNVGERSAVFKKDMQKRRNESRKQVGKENQSIKAKNLELPSLKKTSRKTKDAIDIPGSCESFSNKSPLPKIKSGNRPKTHEKRQLPPIKPSSGSIQKGSARNDTISTSRHIRAPLPSISKGDNKSQVLSAASKKRTRRLPPILYTKERAQNSSNKQKPEAMWISLSPSPTPNNDRRRKQTERRQNSSDQRDKIRVSSGRA